MNKIGFHKLVISIVFLIILIINGCGKNDKYQKQIYSKPKTAINSSSSIKYINVFIENSGSMKNFLDLGGFAHNTIIDLKTNLKKVYPNSSIIIYTIDNKKITVININDFIRIPISTQGNRTTIPYMLEEVVKRSGDRSLNVFISDFIYANGVGSQILDYYRNAINQVFNQYKSDLLVYQLFTKINPIYPGIYFTGSLANSPNQFAPFYLFVLSNKTDLKIFDDNISLKFESPVGISIRKELFEKNSSKLKSINYKVGVGMHSAIGITTIKQGVLNSLTEIVKMKKGRGSNKVQFSVLFSNSNLFVSDKFIEDLDNYTIKPSYFKLEQIKKYTDPNGIYSHEMVVSTNKIMNDTLSIKLKELFSETDSNIVTNPYTTFGLDYLIRGIKDSYSPKLTNEKSQFEIRIPIHLKPDNSLWIIFAILLFTTAVYLFNKFKS